MLDGRGALCEGQLRPHRMPTDAITFLGAATVAGSKRFTPTGTTPYACGAGPFSVLRVSVDSLEDAARYLTQCPPNAFAIRGRAIGDASAIPYRRYRAKPGLPPTIESDPTHRLLPIDIDDDGRDGRALEANAQWYRDVALPEAFRGAACIAMATSSAGLKSGSRMRLWFWCDRAVTDAEATAWLYAYDTAVYRPAQPIYCAPPTFDGVEDPFADRTRAVWLPGGDVSVPADIPAPPARTRAHTGGATPAGGRNTFLTSLAGTLRRKGASEGVLLATLLAANDEFAEPLDEEEVEQIARSIATYDPAATQVTIAAQPVTERARGDAERLLKRVSERIKDDPENWRAHVDALGPHLAQGAITPNMVTTRVARTFGDAALSVTVTPDELRAAVETVASEGATAIATVQESWLADKGAMLSKEGDALIPCAHNFAIVLEHAPELQGVRWDPRFGRVRVWSAPWERPGRAPGDQWDNTDESALRAWLCKWGWFRAPEGLYDAVERAARTRIFDWWAATLAHCAAKWDGVVRLSDPVFVSRLLGCDDRDACEHLRKWLIASVARTFEPGAKVDTVLVLQSRQGKSKGRLLHALLGVGDGALSRGADYFGELTERSRDFNDKDVLAKLAGKVIIEIGENTALASRDQGAVKAFLSARSDEYRAPWERKPAAHPRRFVFIVTTNEDEPLTDLTGNRRYKVLVCVRDADTDFVRENLEMIWGEAVTAYRAGESYHYEADANASETDAHTVADPWVDDLRLAIARNPQHIGLDLQDGNRLIGLRARDALALLDVPTAQRTQATARRASACLRALGWTPGVRKHHGRTVKAFWLDAPPVACDSPG